METRSNETEERDRSMNSLWNIVLYGNEAECTEAIRLLHETFSTRDIGYTYCSVHTREELKKQLVFGKINLAIILSNGADGMEGVYTVKEYDSNIVVFWFSNDYGFGIQSHRLECAYFAVKPLTGDKLTKALNHCDYIGLSFI